MQTRLLISALTLLVLGGAAAAQPATVPSTDSTTPQPAEPHRGISVTTDAMLLVGVADVTVEANVAPHIGLGATLGGGIIVFDPAIKVLIAGASANYYV